MAGQSQGKLRALLRRVEKAAQARKSKHKSLTTFARLFYGSAAIEDLDAFTTDDLAYIAEDSLSFVLDRQRGRHKVRVFNPKQVTAANGVPFTVLEIVNDDMPFLVESVLGELAERGLEVRLLIHPILMVSRDSRGKFKDIIAEGDPTGGNAVRESVIHAHIEFVGDEELLTELTARFTKILNDTRTVVLDWRPMIARLEAAVADYQQQPPPVPVDELAETIQFLQWLGQDHFTLLGMREFTYDSNEDVDELIKVDGSDLGLMRDPELKVLRRGSELVTLTPEVREFLMQPSPLIIAKANVKSHVHRRSYMDYIGIKQFDESGALKGELRVVGLFTSAAYTRSARAIPFLRRKIDLVLRQASFEGGTHSGRALINILESYPRDEFFQIDIDTLVETALGILRLSERPRTRLFVRYDKFDRFVSALVYVPRDAYDTEVRKKIGAILADRFDGRVSAFYPAYPEGTLARVHFIIGRNTGPLPNVDHAELERDVAAAARNWSDNLRTLLNARLKAGMSRVLFDRYGSGFPKIYEDIFGPEVALSDMDKCETLKPGNDLAPNLWLEGMSAGRLNFRLYHLGTPIALTDRLPILQNMGFRAINERSFEIDRKTRDGRECIWLHEIFMVPESGHPVDGAVAKPLIEAAFLAIWNGEAEDDGYNRLILEIGRGWREVSVLRAMGKYLQQVGIFFSQDYLAATLCRHAGLAALLLDLFNTRFDPSLPGSKNDRKQAATAIIKKIKAGLNGVSVLDEDRIIRRFMNVILSTLRTNTYQRGEDGAVRPAIAFKLASPEVEGLPKPHPLVEIFVYSPRIEGVHLRFGRIARGGLRWSDRPQDFRTEVLGLVKAQQVKNAVIVPVGSKGGFFPKRLTSNMTREEFLAEGVACYKIFIGSMLDVTDNLSGAKVIPPKHVVRHDGDDPYLVVAADKGTATFSDIANSISIDREFWLGDAFASGGSVGYDHKKMGITARGGWEAVKRHFREMDRDIQTQTFTAVGCGDMSGDVFGNGMLLSKQTKLLAAFDHRDIFLDPDPDPAISFAERRRLFKLSRSSWNDYSVNLISRGGGVFSRSLKSIKLSPEIKRLVGTTADQLPPNRLITAILKSDVDLLWFGGIGTYIRASSETNADAGDRANDALRITAPELNVKVLGEGANLGVTQGARIEFAQKGGRINNDAIDNSAGVNSSDMEVNIKIALGTAVKAGKLTYEARNAFLATMTDQVAAQVLRNNYEQTLCLSLGELRGPAALELQVRLMRWLEDRELLDREVEGLPDDVDLAERRAQGTGLTRPELAVLLAWAKIALFNDLVAGKVPDDPYLIRDLVNYFPEKMHNIYADEIGSHRLRREIIATMLANSLINLGGSTMVSWLIDETGASVSAIASAFILVREAFRLDEVMSRIDTLDNKVSNKVQYGLYAHVQDLIRKQSVWFLRSVDSETGLARLIKQYQDGIAATRAAILKALNADRRAELDAAISDFVNDGIPKSLAQDMALMPLLGRAPDMVQLSEETGSKIETVTVVFFGIGEALSVDRLLGQASLVAAGDYFDRMALARISEQISVAQRRIAASVLSAKGKDRNVGAWLTNNQLAVERARRSINELAGTGTITLAKLAVAAAYLSDLAGK